MEFLCAHYRNLLKLRLKVFFINIDSNTVAINLFTKGIFFLDSFFQIFSQGRKPYAYVIQII